MEIFAFTQNAVGYEDPGPEPQLRSFDELNLEIPKSAIAGIAGVAAATAVMSAAPDAQAVVYPGDTCPAVGQLQAALNSRGFSAGAVDSVYGPQTAQAVRNFQSFNGLAVDGIAGPSTADALGLAAPGSAFEFGNGCGTDGGGVGGGGNYQVTSSSGVYIRSAPSTGSGIIGSRGVGSTVALTDERVVSGGYTWGRVVGGGWVATNFLSAVGGTDPGQPPAGGGGNYRVTSSSGIYIRSAPSTGSGIIGSRGVGSTVALTDERIVADGYTWGRVVGGGWVATNFLSAVGGANPVPPIGGGGAYRVTSSSGVYVRSSASTGAAIIGSRGFGSTVALTGERVVADGYTWGRAVDGGWVATNFLSPI